MTEAAGVRVVVRLFAALADAAGGARRIELDGVVTVGDVHDVLSGRYGDGFVGRLQRARTWVDGAEATRATTLRDGQEVALLPPFAGG